MAAFCMWSVFILSLQICYSYKPVIFMHGILASYTESQDIFNYINETHPGTKTYSINAYNHLASLENMWDQVHNISSQMDAIMKSSPEGVHLICFSQGGLVCRAVLSTLATHNVDTFISLSSPQAGQYGDTTYLKYLFPKVLKEELYKFLYTKSGQEISVGNYWNDPHHQDLYRNYSQFLAVINNDTLNEKSQEYKQNFLRLKKMVMIGGPDDGVITPWQSSQFGFYNDKETVLDLKQQKWYTEDSFGLQTLDKRKGLVTHTIPNIEHIKWHVNRTVYDCCISPYLT